MKANEAPESKFVYPDKLYARCKDNKTLDISYAPQNMEAVEYVRTDVFIEKAEKYLKSQFIKDVSVLAGSAVNINFSAAIENFVKYMKGE